MRNFRKLDIWMDSRNLVKEIYGITSTLPESEKFGLISQMNKCAISIPSNIAKVLQKTLKKILLDFFK